MHLISHNLKNLIFGTDLDLFGLKTLEQGFVSKKTASPLYKSYDTLTSCKKIQNFYEAFQTKNPNR